MYMDFRKKVKVQVIYFQTIFLIYWLTLLCRKNPTTGEPLYRSPVFMSPWISFFYVLNMVINIGTKIIS